MIVFWLVSAVFVPLALGFVLPVAGFRQKNRIPAAKRSNMLSIAIRFRNSRSISPMALSSRAVSPDREERETTPEDVASSGDVLSKPPPTCEGKSRRRLCGSPKSAIWRWRCICDSEILMHLLRYRPLPSLSHGA